MTRDRVKDMLPALHHFANGGSLWGMSVKGNWFKQAEFITSNYSVVNIIDDKHFEARKAFALGEEVELQYLNGTWHRALCPVWSEHQDYRPKKKKPVYEWQALYEDEGVYKLTESFFTEDEMGQDCEIFELSKRERK